MHRLHPSYGSRSRQIALQALDQPFIEYTRYVLGSGTESERSALASGIKTKLIIKSGSFEFMK